LSGAKNFVDRDTDLHVVRSEQLTLVAQLKRVAGLASVAVFAVDGDP